MTKAMFGKGYSANGASEDLGAGKPHPRPQPLFRSVLRALLESSIVCTKLLLTAFSLCRLPTPYREAPQEPTTRSQRPPHGCFRSREAVPTTPRPSRSHPRPAPSTPMTSSSLRPSPAATCGVGRCVKGLVASPSSSGSQGSPGFREPLAK